MFFSIHIILQMRKQRPREVEWISRERQWLVKLRVESNPWCLLGLWRYVGIWAGWIWPVLNWWNFRSLFIDKNSGAIHLALMHLQQKTPCVLVGTWQPRLISWGFCFYLNFYWAKGKIVHKLIIWSLFLPQAWRFGRKNNEGHLHWQFSNATTQLFE